jgi:ABC-type nitrate/sulfonate/bicarbonate transport system ATPase subunit
MTGHKSTGVSLHVDDVSKSFQSRAGITEALTGVHFDVSSGEFYSIVGPSGCGKSTLLTIIAGLEEADEGKIRTSHDPEPLPSRHSEGSRGISSHRNEIPRQPRDDVSGGAGSRLGTIAYMPQKDLLLPWRTVLENTALGLELTGIPRKDAQKRASVFLSRFGLDGFAESYPATLSGGMRQRAAFLRTILTDRSLVLLDEPFGALDALTRRSMQEWLLDVWGEMQRTVVLITHDVEEAIFLSDRVAVMSPRPGRIIAEHTVDLPRPRSAEIITEPAFVEIKRRVMADLRTGLEKGLNYVSQ